MPKKWHLREEAPEEEDKATSRDCLVMRQSKNLDKLMILHFVNWEQKIFQDNFKFPFPHLLCKSHFFRNDYTKDDRKIYLKASASPASV